MYRIGIGYDTHPLVKDRPLFLGGVSIPYEKGLKGHSDGDVLIHAMMDALLGAATLRSADGQSLSDIGILFPDTDPKYKDIRSLHLLEDVIKRLRQANYQVVHVDAVVICEMPKLHPYYEPIKTCLQHCIKGASINVKATTTEGMNDEGKGLCISAKAVALVHLQNK